MTSGAERADWLEKQARPIADLRALGSTLVVAPHPDDESLGCGGTIAQLRQLGLPVHVLFVSDGTLSHPNSPTYPAPRLRDLRETEAQEALAVLGVAPDACTFLRFPDRRVPTAGSPGFGEVAETITGLVNRLCPDTVLVPWRRDPHPDHRASWQLIQAAQTRANKPFRTLEYLIWLWELGDPADMPQPGEVQMWQVSIGSVMAQRDQAIMAHQSQVTRLIDDDPTAFFLSPDLLRHFGRPRELFLET